MIYEFAQLLLLLIFAALILKTIGELIVSIATIVFSEIPDYDEFHGEHYDYDRDITEDYDIVEDEFGHKSYLIKKDVDND